MAGNQVFDPEFQEIFEAFSQRTAQVLSVDYLKITRQVGRFWLHGRINAVDNDRDFWHLSCLMCTQRVYSLEVEFVDESGSAWLVLSHEASTRLIGHSLDYVIGLQDLEGSEAVFEVVKTLDEDVHVFDFPRLSIDEHILEEYEDKYPHGVQEEDWDTQSVMTEKGEDDQEVYRALPVYIGEPSGVNDPDATQASKRRRTK
ncbi:hypothetical protein CASFOL_000609 [Castilleja foliolosa]|uniref:Telomere replication protein EST3 n=1 Tax=Castilleja foliolosa TaxID=1961234 RepID=A0ABD3EK81_9LAMI